MLLEDEPIRGAEVPALGLDDGLVRAGTDPVEWLGSETRDVGESQHLFGGVLERLSPELDHDLRVETI